MDEGCGKADGTARAMALNLAMHGTYSNALRPVTYEVNARRKLS
jgi:hypothetical protein